ncbi:hypothetical protein ACPFMM_003589 [Vibrio cholerae]
MFDADLVESIESSVVSKSLKAKSLDAPMLSDIQHGQFGFTKGIITAEIMLFVADSNQA